MMLKPIYYELIAISFALLIILGGVGSLEYKSGFAIQELNASVGEIKDNIKWNLAARLTWMGNADNPRIGRDGLGNYHIVWQDDRNGNWDIYYLKVDTEGFKLLNDTRITTYPGNDTNPDMVSNNNTVYVVWQREINSHWAIYFARLTYTEEDIDLEIPPKPLVEGDFNATEPRIAMDSRGYLHLVWQDDRNGNWDIYYDIFNRDGKPMISAKDISQDESNSTRPEIVVDNSNNAHVLWIDERSVPGYSVLYRKISSFGSSLGPVKKISVVSPKSTIHAVFYDDALYVSFSCSREMLAYEVIFTKLNEAGDTIIDDKNLTPLDGKNSMNPQIFVKDSSLFLLWDDVDRGIVRFSTFDLKGNRRGELINLSEEASFEPSMAINSRSIGVVWVKKIEGKSFLYFRSGEFPNLKVESFELHSSMENLTIKAAFSSTFPVGSKYAVYCDNSLLQEEKIFINLHTQLNLSFRIEPGTHEIRISLDPENDIPEYEEDDNSASESIFIRNFSFELKGQWSISLEAGNSTNFSFYLINTGNTMDNYTLEVNYNSSLFSVSYPSRIENVTPGVARLVTMNISSKNGVLSSTYSMEINVTSIATGKYTVKELNITILPHGNFQIGYYSNILGLPGQWISVNLNIYNNGNCRDTYHIFFSENRPWPFHTPSLGNFSLDPGAEFTYELQIYVPTTTPAYEKNTIHFTVISSSNITRHAETALIVAPVHAAKGEIVSIIKGEGYYKLRANIINAGNVPALFTLNISGPLSKFALMSSPLLFLNPGENKTVEMNITLPSSLPAGSYEMYLNVMFQNSTLLSLPIKIGVPEKHSLIMQASKLKEGEKVELQLFLKNTGNAADVVHIKVRLSGVNNSTWMIIYGGKNYTNETAVYLAPNQSATLLLIPANKLKDGKYKLSVQLNASSGIGRTLTIPFFVGVKKMSLWEKILAFIKNNLLYIGITAGTVAAALLYKFKFKK